MNRRNLTIGAIALSLSALFAAAVFQPQPKDDPANTVTIEETTPIAAYTHKILDKNTLDTYPDSADSVIKMLESKELEGKTVLVELSADWCPFCAQLKPEMDKALTKLAGQGADIARLTVIYQEGDYVNHIKGAYAYKNTVAQLSQSGSFPEVQVWKDGEPVVYFKGAMPAELIEKMLKENIKDLIPQKTANTELAPGANPA